MKWKYKSAHLRTTEKSSGLSLVVSVICFGKKEPDDITEIQNTTQMAETTGSQNDVWEKSMWTPASRGTECITGEPAREDNRGHTREGLRVEPTLCARRRKCLSPQCTWAHVSHFQGLPGGAGGKEHACQCRRPKRHGFDPYLGKTSWRRAQQPTPVFLPGESHGQRSLVGHSPWGHKEADVT